MPAPKLYTDEEIREHRSYRSREWYQRVKRAQLAPPAAEVPPRIEANGAHRPRRYGVGQGAPGVQRKSYNDLPRVVRCRKCNLPLLPRELAEACEQGGHHVTP